MNLRPVWSTGSVLGQPRLHSKIISQRTKDRDPYIVLERWLSGLGALAALRKNLGLGPNTHMSVDNYITPVVTVQHPLLASVGIRHVVYNILASKTYHMKKRNTSLIKSTFTSLFLYFFL